MSGLTKKQMIVAAIAAIASSWAAAAPDLPHDYPSRPLRLLIPSAAVEVFFASARFVLPYVNSGALRAIAVSSPKRAAVLPGVPTIAESGHVGFDVTDWFAFFVPRGTAAETIHRLHVGLVNAALTSGVKQVLRRNGAESLTSISNIEVLQRVRSDSAKYATALSGVNFKSGGPSK